MKAAAQLDEADSLIQTGIRRKIVSLRHLRRRVGRGPCYAGLKSVPGFSSGALIEAQNGDDAAF